MAYVAFADNGNPDDLFWDFVEEYVIFEPYTYSELEDVVWSLYTNPSEIWDCYRYHRMDADSYRDPFYFGPKHFRSGINIFTSEEHYQRTFANKHYHRFFGVKARYAMKSLYPKKPCCGSYKQLPFSTRWWFRTIFQRRHILPGDIRGWDAIYDLLK